MIGPSHAFTPWTAIYKEYNSLKDCYGGNWKKIKFLELGLSADTSMADKIKELQDLTFLSNSDAHSPWPHRLGREFNRLALKNTDFKEIEKVLKRKNGRKVTQNIGLTPQQGKYHITACSRCYLKFKKEEAQSFNWQCPECRGSIKKGVSDRVEELASWDTPHHPNHRPPYLHILPLAEVISLATGTNVNTKTVEREWNQLIERLGTEIKILLDLPIEKIGIVNKKVSEIIDKFRGGKISYIAGGGGKYGEALLQSKNRKKEGNYWGQGQTTLNDF